MTFTEPPTAPYMWVTDPCADESVAGAPRGVTAHYAVTKDGRIIERGPDGRLRSLTDDVKRVTAAFGGMASAAANAGMAMTVFQRALFGDDPTQPDEYVNFPDPPPAYLYR